MIIVPQNCLNEQEVADFHHEGYIIRRGLFDAEEMELLRTAAKTDLALADPCLRCQGPTGVCYAAVAVERGGRRPVRRRGPLPPHRRCHGSPAGRRGLSLPFQDEREGALPRAVPGDRHQDYGYWYQNGCLFPYMASAFIAVDPNTRENGCMQVLRGSHLMGRIEHGVAAGQTGANMERVQVAMQRMEHFYVEMEPGDALFFHCNTLHCSDQNRSPNPRGHRSALQRGPQRPLQGLAPAPLSQAAQGG